MPATFFAFSRVFPPVTWALTGYAVSAHDIYRVKFIPHGQRAQDSPLSPFGNLFYVVRIPFLCACTRSMLFALMSFSQLFLCCVFAISLRFAVCSHSAGGASTTPSTPEQTGRPSSPPSTVTVTRKGRVFKLVRTSPDSQKVDPERDLDYPCPLDNCGVALFLKENNHPQKQVWFIAVAVYFSVCRAR